MAFNPDNGSLEVQLATKMQLILDQPSSDLSSGLVNKDFEGDFFKIGDKVNIVKPDINSVNVEVGQPIIPTATQKYGDTMEEHVANATSDDIANYSGDSAGNNDARLKITDLMFEKATLEINKTAKYAFAISDILEAEGRFNYESGALDLAAWKIRKKHNLETAQLILDGSAAPVDGEVPTGKIEQMTVTVSNAEDIYEKLIVPIFAKLYDRGAITADGQVSFGSNQTVQKRTYGKIYVPTAIYTELLKSRYLTDRATVAADEKVETGKVKTILGLDIAIEPSLAGTTAGDLNHVKLPTGTLAGTMVVVAGTQNTVTRAGKVMPPEKFRSHTRFADEYHGMEIYGQEVVSPESAVVALVTLA